MFVASPGRMKEEAMIRNDSGVGAGVGVAFL
jgi:hypothetical protein